MNERIAYRGLGEGVRSTSCPTPASPVSLTPTLKDPRIGTKCAVQEISKVAEKKGGGKMFAWSGGKKEVNGTGTAPYRTYIILLNF